jgi:hypothetical protein
MPVSKMRASCAPVVQHRQATATLGKWPPGHFSPVARGSASDQNKGGAYAADSDTRPAPGVTARAAHAAPSCTVPSAELAPRITELGRRSLASWEAWRLTGALGRLCKLDMEQHCKWIVYGAFSLEPMVQEAKAARACARRTLHLPFLGHAFRVTGVMA